MNSSSALSITKTVVRWLAVLGLALCAATGVVYSVNPMSIARGLMFLLVVAGGKLAPRYRLATAIVLAAVLIAHSYWGHVRVLAPEGASHTQLLTLTLTGHFRHFNLDAVAPVLAVVYVFWSEKAKRTGK